MFQAPKPKVGSASLRFLGFEGIGMVSIFFPPSSSMGSSTAAVLNPGSTEWRSLADLLPMSGLAAQSQPFLRGGVCFSLKHHTMGPMLGIPTRKRVLY